MKVNDVRLVLIIFMWRFFTPPTVKSDSSLLFKKLRELNTVHRIILTGVSSCNHVGIVSSDNLPDAIEQQHPRAIQSHEFPRSSRLE
jgi:hypothetical protein